MVEVTAPVSSGFDTKSMRNTNQVSLCAHCSSHICILVAMASVCNVLGITGDTRPSGHDASGRAMTGELLAAIGVNSSSRHTQCSGDFVVTYI